MARLKRKLCLEKSKSQRGNHSWRQISRARLHQVPYVKVRCKGCVVRGPLAVVPCPVLFKQGLQRAMSVSPVGACCNLIPPPSDGVRRRGLGRLNPHEWD